MIHLSDKAKEVKDYLNKFGFKIDPSDPREQPVYVSASFTDMEEDRAVICGLHGDVIDRSDLTSEEVTELELLPPPEMTEADFDIRRRDYCCIVIDADLYSVMPEENPYLDMDLVHADVTHKYKEAIHKYLRKEFGDDVEIRSTGYGGGDVEFEIERKAV